MAKRYQHVTDQVRQDIGKRVGGLLWEAAEGAAGGPDGGGEAGEAGWPLRFG
jgi:integrase